MLTDVNTMKVIDDVLAVFHDDQWHNIEEIKARCGLTDRKLGMAIAFLKEYDFVKMDSQKRVRANKLYMDFVRKIRWAEHSGVATATKV